MPINTLFIIASFILGFLLVAFIRTYDIHEKEPYFKMLLTAMWGGFWSVALSLAQYHLAEKLGIRIYHNFFGAIFIIGPIEELSKFLALLSSYFFIKKELNEPTDGLIYMSCVALGFSLIENYFYAVRSINSGYLLWLRLFISTPSHIFFSAFMGIAFFSVTKQKKGFSLLIISFIYASLIHGLFNGVLFHNWLIIFFILVIKFSYHWTFTLLSYTTSKSPFRESLSDFLMNSEPKIEKGIECLHCGDTTPKKTFKKNKIIIQKCNNCPCYVSNHDSIYYIFHHFGSDFRNMTNQYYLKDEKSENKLRRNYASVFKGNYICNISRKAFFFLDELSSAIDEYNLKLQKNIEEKWWFPETLKSD
ncbi:MAG: PrsW family intramembrane metalloprotease [Desulfobacter sp.]|nr:MAG: PrsW family intramembrane metalloprotease [Desulfobacter sp.]